MNRKDRFPMLKGIYDRLPKGKVYGLLGLLLLLIVLEVVMTCLIPMWREYFYNVLEGKKSELFSLALVYFFSLMSFLGIAQGLKVWIGQLLAADIRNSATKEVFRKWVEGGHTIKNYSQAMSESLRNTTEGFIEVMTEIVISLTIVIVLIVSNLHNAPIVIASIIYTLIASGLALLFNKPLTNKDRDWQNTEGELREAFGDIANGNGDYTTQSKLKNTLTKYFGYIKVNMYFTLFTRMKSSVSSLVPYLLLATPFFSGAITLGDFMAGSSTFELIVINSTILIILYPKLIKAKASYYITKEFYNNSKEGKQP